MQLRHLVDTLAIALNFQNNRLVGSKRPFLDTKSGLERPIQPEIPQYVFVVMRICSLVFLSSLDASFESQ